MQRPVSLSILLLLALTACGGAIAEDGRNDENPGPPAPSDPSPVPPTPQPWTPETPPPSPPQPPIGTTPTPADLPVLPPLPAKDTPPTGSEAEQLQWMKTSIVGKWRGLAKSPWKPIHGVEITFAADLHYSAHCIGASDCVAFYYGEGGDSAAHVYDLVDVRANQEGVGTLYPWSSPGSWTGGLERVTFHGNATRLTFEFYNGQIGPIVYDLERVP